MNYKEIEKITEQYLERYYLYMSGYNHIYTPQYNHCWLEDIPPFNLFFAIFGD
jgi:hypothetical protein